MTDKPVIKTFEDVYGISPGKIDISDKHITATEVQLRMKEASKRFPTPNFSGAINALARKFRRIDLLDALQGSREDRLGYCIYRAAAKSQCDLVCYGTAIYDPNKLSELAVRWFERLQRLAERMEVNTNGSR